MGHPLENHVFTLKGGKPTDCVLGECEEYVESYYGSGTVKYMKLTAPVVPTSCATALNTVHKYCLFL